MQPRPTYSFGNKKFANFVKFVYLTLAHVIRIRF